MIFLSVVAFVVVYKSLGEWVAFGLAVVLIAGVVLFRRMRAGVRRQRQQAMSGASGARAVDPGEDGRGAAERAFGEEDGGWLRRMRAPRDR